ncbi:MAG: YdiU family protein [Burkholderiaceae bacterium]
MTTTDAPARDGEIQPRERIDIGAAFDNSYARELDGAYVRQAPATVAAPRMVRFNHRLAEELGIDPDPLDGPLGARIFSGNALPAGADPLAQAYAGHQFGGFSPQLGDGRALLLGEIVDRHGRRRDIALKGSGRTPFSRGGDGKAALGPVLREYLMGETMQALGIPTTRALAAVSTGERVYRDSPLPGAVLTRVAASHLRVGTFQFFAARGQDAFVERLLDYTIARHDPALRHAPDRALRLLEAVARRQAELIAQWMRVGFIHGVMNTDNMTLSGETIDFGPCAFLEAYDPQTVFSSIDHGGRYAFGNQPHLARWNLARFAETLLPSIDADRERAIARATEIIDAFPGWFEERWSGVLRDKLGLLRAQADDGTLASEWLDLMHAAGIDYTLGWRALATEVHTTGETPADGAPADRATGFDLASLFAQADPAQRARRDAWLGRWRARRLLESAAPAEQLARMRAASPAIVARNHKVEEALTAALAGDGDMAPFERLLAAVAAPYDERPGLEDYRRPAPREVTARYQTFCGT